MMDLLQQFMGGNPQRQQDYSDFLRRYQQDPGSISDEEAARRYRELTRNAPQDLADEADEHAFGQLPPQDRRQLADQYQDATRNPARPFDGYGYEDPEHGADPRNLGRMTRQAENQDPDLFGQLFGQNSPLSGPLGKAALAAGAAYLASRMLSGQGGMPQGGMPQGGMPQGGGLGGLGDLLGGGGLGGSGGQQGQDIPGINTSNSDFDKQI